MKIAVLGATSHIAKNLIRLWLADPGVDLHLFARNPVAVDGFVTQLGYSGIRPAFTFADFGQTEYAAVINCVGFGNPASLRDAGYSLFTVTEYYDSMILAYLENNPDCVYVNMSSGAVYRGAFSAPVDDSTAASFLVNNLQPADRYALAKLYSEIKHRAASGLSIIDLRVFSFFSRHIDPAAGFLLSDIVRCVRDRSVFVTGQGDLVRDYIHPEDLFCLVNACIASGPGTNCAIDAYSREPVSKSDLLEYYRAEWDLKVEFRDGNTGVDASGKKDLYCSQFRKARDLFGYQPGYSSLETVASETRVIFNQ